MCVCLLKQLWVVAIEAIRRYVALFTLILCTFLDRSPILTCDLIRLTTWIYPIELELRLLLASLIAIAPEIGRLSTVRCIILHEHLWHSIAVHLHGVAYQAWVAIVHEVATMHLFEVELTIVLVHLHLVHQA